jgi:inosose dehydratase
MAIKVASAPINWGIMEHVELPAEYPYSRVLDEIKTAGYSGTELGPYGFLPTDSAVLRKALPHPVFRICGH